MQSSRDLLKAGALAKSLSGSFPACRSEATNQPIANQRQAIIHTDFVRFKSFSRQQLNLWFRAEAVHVWNNVNLFNRIRY